MAHQRLSVDASPPSVSRAIAFSVLIESTRSEAGLEALMDRALARRPALDARDRALATEIAYGVMRRLGTIDWRLHPLLEKPLERLPTAVQMVLRIGAYQLLFLDRVPASAAVSESVKLAKAQSRTLKRDWSGLVNAVLRALIRQPVPPWPSRDEHPVHALAVRYSVPEWLSRRWLERLGLERAEAACAQVSQIPPLTLRVNVVQTSRDAFLSRLEEGGIAAAPTRIGPAGITLLDGAPIPALPGFLEGQFYVEDEAAQLVPPLLDVHPGQLILDACAAPGGKATHLAELIGDSGRIYAVDRSQARLNLLEANCRRLRHTRVVPVRGDVSQASWMELLSQRAARGNGAPRFDRILVDVPCSGLGVLRRHPEAKWQKRSGQFERHHAEQLRILNAAASCLRPGGVLVYSTCSTEPEENEGVIEEFLQSHTDFRRESVAPWLPKEGHDYLTRSGDLSTIVNRDSMDGFYAARLTNISS